MRSPPKQKAMEAATAPVAPATPGFKTRLFINIAVISWLLVLIHKYCNNIQYYYATEQHGISCGKKNNTLNVDLTFEVTEKQINTYFLLSNQMNW